MYGLPSAYLSGDFSKIGSFYEVPIEMKTFSKRMLILPEIIDERGIATKANGEWFK